MQRPPPPPHLDPGEVTLIELVARADSLSWRLARESDIERREEEAGAVHGARFIVLSNPGNRVGGRGRLSLLLRPHTQRPSSGTAERYYSRI